MPNLFQAPPQNPILLQQAQDPRTALAQSLIAAASSARPVNSPWEGIARLGSGLAGALIARNAGKEYKQRGENYNATLAQALQASQPWKAPDNVMNEAGTEVVVPRGQEAPGTGGMGALVAALRNNPDTAPMALNLQFEDMTRRQGIGDQKDMARFTQDLAIEGAPRMQAAQLPGAIAQARGVGGVNNELAMALESQLGPVRTQNAVGQAQALGPVQAANAGLTAAAQQPYEMARIAEQGRVTAANQPRGPAGPFAGNAMDAQVQNILLNGNPADPAYQQAYNIASAPKTVLQDGQLVTITPPMTGIRPPAGMAQATGSAPAIGGGVTTQRIQDNFNETQGKAAGFTDRMGDAEKVLSVIGADQGTSRIGQVLSRVPLGNELQSDDFQKYDQARRNFINAQLRRESGAVISPEEFDNANKQYFPVPGDKPPVIAQKAQNRAAAIEAMKRDAGPSYKGAAAPAQIYVNPTTGEKVQWDGKAYVPVP